MTIVLDEHNWAEEMIAEHSLGKKPFETMCRVARYYLDNGAQPKEVRHMLDLFLLQCDHTASLTKWTESLDRALSFASKHKAIAIDGISVSKPEMERIENIESKQAQRLAFTLLCLSKYWNAALGREDSWVNNKDSEIMRMANINTSIRCQCRLYHDLREAGLIQFSKRVDNTTVRVCFSEPGEEVMRVTDFRNLGYQYKMYHGEPFFVCSNCGITTRIENVSAHGSRRGPKQKYCKECAAKVASRQRVEHNKRRNGKKARKGEII